MNMMINMKNFLNILKKLGIYIPIFNYYENIKGPEFDKKYLFLTNNISKNINKILNQNFNTKYRKTRLNPPVTLFPPFKNFDFFLFDFYALIPPSVSKKMRLFFF